MAPAQTPANQLDKNDSTYRDQLISEYLPYVKRIVHRIAVHLPSTIDIDDLMNVGVIGLIQAVDRYDPRRDNKFMTYAVFIAGFSLQIEQTQNSRSGKHLSQVGAEIRP